MICSRHLDFTGSLLYHSLHCGICFRGLLKSQLITLATSCVLACRRLIADFRVRASCVTSFTTGLLATVPLGRSNSDPALSISFDETVDQMVSPASLS